MAEESRMRVELEESVLCTYNKVSDIRPQNTSRAYTNKQNEFKQWCVDKGAAFNDSARFTVTGPKLHLFLEECVIGREKRRKGHNGRSEKVGRSTVNSYTAAMVDLWRQQKRLNINNYPSPRDDAVTALLKITEYEEDDRRRKNFADRGADTMLDGYTTTDQLQKISHFFWTSSHDPGTSMRNLLAFLLSHFALMRGESARRMELADLHSVMLENEGYSFCRALVMVMSQGKTNQVGRVEVGSCMRNKNVDICPHGLLGFYLFWRWHVDLETFPDFSSSEQWYPVKLLKTGKDPTKPMSYKVHREAIAGALEHIGLRSRAKTHVGRGSGARMADLGGASEAQIRRLGRWNNQAMEKCYLTSLPREAMRTLAGFEPGRGSYYLVRSCVDPPLELQKQIFPMVEDWQSKMANGVCEQSIAAGGFLELLQYLRIVILQDAVTLSEQIPGHPLWKHGIFQCAEFNRFRDDLKASMANTDDPTERQLEKAMPVLKATLDGIHKDLKASVSSVRTSIEMIEGNLADVVSVLAPLSGGSTLLEVKIVNGVSLATPIPPPNPETCAMVDTTTDNQGVPNYRLSRGIQTIRELWTEWVHGLPGGIAVAELEQQFGTKWCSNLERRFFNRRRKIIDLVKNTATAVSQSKGIDSCRATNEVIDRLDSIRTARKKTLNWVSQNADEIARELATQSSHSGATM